MFENYQSSANVLLTNLKSTCDVKTLNQLYALAYYAVGDHIENAKSIFKWTAVVKARAMQMATRDPSSPDFQNYLNLYWNSVLLESPYLFDSYLLYLEKNREPKDRFYLPKRKQFMKIGVIQTMQALEDDELDIATLSLPPGTGKTTIEKFFITWVIGRKPSEYNLFYSHSGDITRMFFDGILDICTNDEYTFNEIFPMTKIHSVNAKRQLINFNTYKPFSNLQTTSVGAKNAGKVRVSEHGYLLCDDLIGGIEEAMSADRLEKLWQTYTVDARQRKKDGAKELHVCTRWSVADPVGRLIRAYEDSPNPERRKFIAVPDIDPETGQSNFDYDIGGMSVEFFNDQAKLMDDVSYRCLYKNEPIEREGLLYHAEDFERYLDLPDGDPDAILGVCDTKDKGTDYCCMLIMYQYGDRYFLHDLVYSNASPDIIDIEMEDCVVRNDPHQVQFESNSAGGRVADDLRKKLQSRKCRTAITKKFTTANKETKIIVNSTWVKQHVILKDSSLYVTKSQYASFVRDLLSYSIAGKNKHDDAPDALAMFAEFSQKLLKPTMIVTNPFAQS